MIPNNIDYREFDTPVVTQRRTLGTGALILFVMSLTVILFGGCWTVTNLFLVPPTVKSAAVEFAPTSTPAPTLTATGTATPVPSMTNTPRPSHTPRPSRTTAPTWTASATMSATPTRTLTPTMDITQAWGMLLLEERDNALLKERLTIWVVGVLMIAGAILFSLFVIYKFGVRVLDRVDCALQNNSQPMQPVSNVPQYDNPYGLTHPKYPDAMARLIHLADRGWGPSKITQDFGVESGGGGTFYLIRRIMRQMGYETNETTPPPHRPPTNNPPTRGSSSE